jgi:hypothetical protein
VCIQLCLNIIKELRGAHPALVRSSCASVLDMLSRATLSTGATSGSQKQLVLLKSFCGEVFQHGDAGAWRVSHVLDHAAAPRPRRLSCVCPCVSFVRAAIKASALSTLFGIALATDRGADVAAIVLGIMSDNCA